MPEWTLAADLTTNNLPNFGGRGKQKYRVSNAVNTYLPGTVLQLVPINSQILPDFQTVQPLAAGTTSPKVVGVVPDGWAGFSGQGTITSGLAGSTDFTSPATQTNVRGTPWVDAVVKGVAYCFVDQSGANAVTITDGIPIVSSRNTAGFGQGVALVTATNCQCQIGQANLPSSGIGSSLTAAALAQATQTFTVGGTPASGDVLTVTLQIPYTDAAPGTAQTHAISVTLNSTTAASTTTAATALAAALNADPYFATSGTAAYYIATSSAAVVTVTINTLSNPFLVTFGTTASAGNAVEQARFYTHISGMVANSLTTASSVSAGAGSTLTAGGSTFSGGTGYYGRIPIIVNGEY